MTHTHGRAPSPWRAAVLTATFWAATASLALAQAPATPESPRTPPPGGMNPLLHDAITSVAWIVFAVGIVATGWKVAAELQAIRQLRAAEGRRAQAEQARMLLDDLLQDDRAAAAMLLIEWDGRTFEVEKGRREDINRKDVRAAFHAEREEFGPKDMFIHERFDRLYFHLGRIERSLRSGLVLFEDVEPTVENFVKLMGKECEVYKPYLDEHNYALALGLLGRFKEWSEPAGRRVPWSAPWRPAQAGSSDKPAS